MWWFRVICVVFVVEDDVYRDHDSVEDVEVYSGVVVVEEFEGDARDVAYEDGV